LAHQCEAVENGVLELDSLEEPQLPSSVQALPRELREQYVLQEAKTRAELTDRIKDLATRRDDDIAKKLAASGEAKESLDNKLYSTTRRQTAAKVMRYDSAPKY
jgi:hypothetical protein